MVSDKSLSARMHGRVSAEKGKRGRRAGGFVFPRLGLKETLRLAEAIERENGGQPFSRLTLAKVLDMSPNGDNFRALISASTRYGLTEGSHVAEKLSLTPNGAVIVSASSDEQAKKKALLSCLMLPKVFQDVFTRFNGKSIPSEISLKDTLRSDFGVPSEDVNAVYQILDQNMKDYGLVEEIRGTKYLQLEKLAPVILKQEEMKVEQEEKQTGTKESGEGRGIEQPSKIAPPAPATVEVKVPRVFISHSKNKTILGQIKQVLDFGKFQYVIAEEKETTAIPLPDKVFNLMWECNCAIINVSADTEKKQGDGFGINENVIAELWGAFLHYKKRVILVIDSRLKDKLPSMMQGLTAIFYEGDKLAWDDGIRLQKALDEFRNQL
jgi:predicted nucleotide-binding protein